MRVKKISDCLLGGVSALVLSAALSGAAVANITGVTVVSVPPVFDGVLFPPFGMVLPPDGILLPPILLPPFEIVDASIVFTGVIEGETTHVGFGRSGDVTLITVGTLTSGEVEFKFENTGLFAYTPTLTGNAITVSVERQGIAETAARLKKDGMLGGMCRLLAGPSWEVAELLESLDALFVMQDLRTWEQKEAVLRQLAPVVSNAGGSTARSATSQATNTAMTRLSSLRAGDAAVAQAGATGVSTGDAAVTHGMWGQTFGATAEQSAQGIDSGFDAKTFGIAYGIDREFAFGTLGVAGSFGRSAVSAGRLDLSIDSYQGTLYGSHGTGPWTVDGALSYTLHRYKSDRSVAGALAQATYSGHEASARIGTGYTLSLGSGLNVTPNGSLQYAHLIEQGYTETGSLAPLVVSSRSTDSLRSEIGVRAAQSFVADGATITPEVRLGWGHEFASTAPVTTARFAAGGGTFGTRGIAPVRDSLLVGAGLTLARTETEALTLNYDGELKSHYGSHTGTLSYRLQF